MSQAPYVAFAASEDPLVGTSAPDPGSAASAARPPHAPDRGCDAGEVGDLDPYRHCVSLKGTTRGLEILISGTPTTAALGERLTELLAEAPSFFAGSDARVAIDGALPGGALACLEEVAARFELRIVEIGPMVARRRRPEVTRVARSEEMPRVRLADGTGPVADDDAAVDIPGYRGAQREDRLADDVAGEVIEALGVEPSSRLVAGELPSAAAPHAATPTAAPPSAAESVETMPSGARLVIGPLRSGMIVEHPGHLVVVGDVNPGAEVRAGGSIIVLGRLRGVAHAAIGRDGGFIVALSLQPQQLRIGRMVTRAGDADRPGDGAEIAYATGETIVVERFLGRLPSGLAASM